MFRTGCGSAALHNTLIMGINMNIILSDVDLHQVKTINTLRAALQTEQNREEREAIRRQLDAAEAALGWSIVDRVNTLC